MGLLLSGKNPAAYKTAERTTFTATAGQTTFTVPVGYNVGDVDVFLNGLKLVDGDDFFATNGTSVVLASGANVGDSLSVVCYYNFLNSSSYTKAESDARYLQPNGQTPMSSYLRTPNYGISSYSDSANASLEANPGLGTQGTAIKAWGRSVATNGGDIHYVTDTRGAGGSHRFYGWNGTSLSTLGGIDSLGRFTTPLQPRASLSHTGAIAITSDTDLTSSNFYDTSIVNIGGYFNASTGRFTCPVAGVYRIFFRCTSSGTGCNVRLRKNGTGINEAYGGGGGDLQTVCSEAIVSCVAGDYLHIQVNTLNAIAGPQHKQVTFELLG